MMSHKRLRCYAIPMLLFLVSLEGQTVRFSRLIDTPPSICDEGLAAKEENFTLLGMADIRTAAKPNEWDNIGIGIERKLNRENYTFVSIGRLFIDLGCNGYQPEEIYCLINGSNGVYYFIVNMTTSPILSRAVMRAVWTSKFADVEHSNYVTLPVVNVRDEHLNNVTVGDILLENLRSPSCFINNMTNRTPVTFCVADKPGDSTFDLRILLNDVMVTRSDRNCATASTWNVGAKVTLEFEFLKSNGCTRRGTYKCKAFIKGTVPRTKHTTGETTRKTSSTTITPTITTAFDTFGKVSYNTLWPVLALIVFSVLVLIGAVFKIIFQVSANSATVKTEPTKAIISPILRDETDESDEDDEDTKVSM